MRFFEQMLQVAADETVKGNIVLAPFSVIATADQGSDLKQMLDKLHFEKIRMCSQIIVVTDQNGYMGGLDAPGDGVRPIHRQRDGRAGVLCPRERGGVK